LKRHGRDLTLEAAEGRLDPLIGRHDVLERTMQVLLRRTKNNPVLIGDPGVGKTAVAEGIAQLIVSPAAPPGLAGRALIAVDVGSLVAGTQYRGAFEERLTSLLREVHMAAGRVILFIDELHMLMDAGRVEGGMNAANLLKPALARGDLHCLGATTVEEYRKHIEQDGAFARRFQPVMVEEPTPEEAVTWLRGLRGRYERYHGVRFTDAALSTAVRAAQQYIPDRRLPDSAIDVIDEAAARARLHAGAAAAAAAAAAATQAHAAAALGRSGAGVQGVAPLYSSGSGSWEENQRLMEWLSAVRQQSEAGPQLPAAAAAGGPPAGPLHSSSSGGVGSGGSRGSAGPLVVDSADVLSVVAEASGIPSEHLSQSDWQSLSSLEARMRLHLAGQHAAVAAVVGAVRLGRLGLQRGKRPLASLLLTGPPGVGKATLCQALACALFGSDRHLLRLNLAEYGDKASVSRLVGAPPGYVGFGDGGLLTDAIRRRPHSVVLLERVDRAHPEVLSLIVQVLESGQLQDGMGKRCDFRNALLCLQPDAGGSRLGAAPQQQQQQQQQQAAVHPLRHLPSELLSRLDCQVSMAPLSPADMLRVVELQLAECQAALGQQGIGLRVEPDARRWLAARGLSPASGARRLQSLLREQLLLPVAEALL
ncbi:hypothetical protein CHLNCDRAFT_6558, partial [Chlorella variabilis]